jgi:hypothetical protein
MTRMTADRTSTMGIKYSMFRNKREWTSGIKMIRKAGITIKKITIPMTDRRKNIKNTKKAIKIEYNTISPVVLLKVSKKMKYSRIRMARFTMRAR